VNTSSITKVSGKAVLVPGNDIDTDRIIPARYMKAITFAGLGKYAFIDERFDEQGKAKGHPFDDPRFRGASILLVNKNFGCGSSREHAPQALRDWGIRAVIGESFAEIFAGNCTAMGIPIACVGEANAQRLSELVEADPSLVITLDLDRQIVTAGQVEAACTIPQAYRNSLLDGSWDSTGTLLANRAEIEATVRRIPYLSGFQKV